MNLIEKIAQKFALNQTEPVKSGDYVSIAPAYVMTHDNTGAVIPKFRSMGAKKVANPRQIVCALDHNIQDSSKQNLQKYAKIEEFCSCNDIDFYPAGRGIGHQIMCEEGYIWPETLVVASDSHSNMYGGLGCLGTPVVRTDAAAIWATGKTWWQIPPVAKVTLFGKLEEGISGKDIIIALCGHFNNDEVLNHAIEFTGEAVSTLSIDERLTIANMTTEWGALAGVFPVDERTIAWLETRSKTVAKHASDKHPRFTREKIALIKKTAATPNAHYAKELTLNLSSIQPHVSGPNSVKIMTPVSKIETQQIKIDKAYLVSCVNSRFEDIAKAAKIVSGKKIAKGVEFYVAAASSEVQAQSEASRDWQTLLAAGAKPLPPGCGPCIGLGEGILKENEVGISATNRNFKGRMGAISAQVYLASPETVAASAIKGIICGAKKYSSLQTGGEIVVHPTATLTTTTTEVLHTFPKTLEGNIVFCPQDNLNTDGIYPGKYTYMDDFTPEQQAQVVMENYDREFATKVKKGDFLVCGFNFGTGSSREQAATALKHKGIALVVAGSFSETYKRNALNNGFIVLEIPELIRDLKKTFAKQKELTILTKIKAQIDFVHAKLKTEHSSYSIPSMGIAAQELIVCNGLENWVRANLATI